MRHPRKQDGITKDAKGRKDWVGFRNLGKYLDLSLFI